MAWRESRVVDERVRFIAAVAESDEPFAELCRQFGVSRKTGYKWVERYELHGPGALEDRTPVPKRCPHRLPDPVADLVVQARKAHPRWGPKKLRALLGEEHPELVVPATSTIGELLKRSGLIRPRRRRLRVPLHSSPLEPSDRPNGLWAADFKGHFALGDRSRCYPLTISDDYSRYLLKCEGLSETNLAPVQAQFELAFREFGLPERMRTDNGPPFASSSLGGLTALSVWWIKLGIIPERIEPGKPEQNGRHERMHRTLKDEATKPPCATLAEQQRAFDRFRHEYNDLRPHEALAQKQPAKLYATSRRPYSGQLRDPEYGDDVIVRRADQHGRLDRKGKKLCLTRHVSREAIGLREIDDGRWELFFGPVLLGILDETRGEPRLVRAA